MKIKSLAAVAVILSSSLSFADVYSDALFWLRDGVATDKNNNGYYENGEQRDVCGRSIGGNSSYSATGIVYRTETGRLSSRYVDRTLRSIYFAQHVQVTNESTGAGTGQPSLISITRKVAYEKYSAYCRFRPDAKMPASVPAWLIGLGYGWQQGGFLIGVQDVGNGARKNICIYQWNKQTTLCSLTNSTDWVDLVVSTDGSKINWKCCRARPTGDNERATQMGTVSLASGSSVKFALNGSSTYIRLGGWDQAWENKTLNPASPSDYWKCFRGSVQQFAFWDRALTDEEMFEAMAWPRADLMKVGIDNDAVDEFGVGGATAVDADGAWTAIPSNVAANASMTIRFPLFNRWELEAQQTVLWKATSASGDGVVRASLNGVDLGEQEIRGGASANWFAATNAFVTGTNVLVLTRTDAGATPLQADSISLGGSWQLGYKNGNETEFVHENYGLPDYFVFDGNFKDVRKGIVPGGSTSNFYIHVREPDDFRRLWCRHRMDYHLVSSSSKKPRFSFILNGETIEEFAFGNSSSHEGSVRIAPGKFKAGDNVLELRATADGTDNQWSTLDYLRMSVEPPPKGAMIIVR